MNGIVKTPGGGFVPILGDGTIDEGDELYSQQQPTPPAQAAKPRSRVYNQINVYDQLGDIFPEGKIIDVDPPLSLANVKLNIYAIDPNAKDKRKARQLVDTVPPPMDGDTLEATYGAGRFLIQAIRVDNGQMFTQATREVEGEPTILAAPAGPAPADMAATIAQAIAVSLAPLLQQQKQGPDKYTALLEKIALAQITEGGGSANSKVQQAQIANALELQAEQFKQQLAMDRQKQALNLKLEEKKIERQWRKEDEAVRFQQEVMLKQLNNEVPDEEDSIEPPSAGTSVIALAEIIQESLGLKKIDILGGMDLGTFIEPLAGKLEKALGQKGYHIVTKKDLETMHEAGRQAGYLEGQQATLNVAKKVRRELEGGSNAGKGGGRPGPDDTNNRAGVPAGDTGSVDS